MYTLYSSARCLARLCILVSACLSLSACFQVHLNGPVGGATLTLAQAAHPGQVLQTTTSKDEAALIEEYGPEAWARLGPSLQLLYLGTAEFDNSQLRDHTLYLVTASGGLDYDYDHDGVRDSVPTPIAGSWHMRVTGAQLKSHFAKLSLLTEADYQLADPSGGDFAFVGACDRLIPIEDCLSDLDFRGVDSSARQLVTDVDRDGRVTSDDLLRWTRAARETAYRWDTVALDQLADWVRTGAAINTDAVAEGVYRAVEVDALVFDDPQLDDCVRRFAPKYAHQITRLSCFSLRPYSIFDPNDSRLPDELTGITSLQGIEQLTGLQFLSISFNTVSAVAPLAELEHLSILNLSYNPLLDAEALAVLGSAKRLSQLNLNGLTLSTLEWAEQLPQLRYLQISGDQPDTDRLLASIARLPSLEGLSLTQASLTDTQLASLAANSKVRRLSLRLNRLQQLDALTAMPDLEWLDVSRNELTSLDPLRHLGTLEYLNVGDNDLDDLEPVLELAQLQELYADSCGLAEIPALAQLQQLRVLVVSENELQDLSEIRDLPALTILGISGNQLDSLGDLQQLPELETLLAASNALTSLAPLEQFQKLSSVYVANNQLTSLAPLATLPDIRLIDADANQLTSTRELSGVSSLRNLLLRQNRITDLTLSGLPELGLLQLDDNEISSLDGLGSLPSLRTLSLQSNTLESVDALNSDKLPVLRSLDLDENLQLSCAAVDELRSRLASVQITASSCALP